MCGGIYWSLPNMKILFKPNFPSWSKSYGKLHMFLYQMLSNVDGMGEYSKVSSHGYREGTVSSVKSE